MKVGYQGVNGTFSEMAVQEYFKGQSVERKNYRNFVEILAAVQSGEIDYALIPVENTTTGLIFRSYDLLKQASVFAIGEIDVRICENLITLKGVSLDEITEVYTHPEVIGQCSEFFKQHPQIRSIPCQDTAKAVELVQQWQDRSKAALASRLAGEIYNLPILLSDVQDNKINVTRFFCISAKEEVSSEADTISCVLTLKHEAGSLYAALRTLADHGINMLNLQSRPLPHKLFEYCFYLDFEGNLQDESMQRILAQLQENCLEFKIIGCYKRQRRSYEEQEEKK